MLDRNNHSCFTETMGTGFYEITDPQEILDVVRVVIGLKPMDQQPHRFTRCGAMIPGICCRAMSGHAHKGGILIEGHEPTAISTSFNEDGTVKDVLISLTNSDHKNQHGSWSAGYVMLHDITKIQLLTGQRIAPKSPKVKFKHRSRKRRIRVRLNTKLLARVKRHINRPTKSPLPSFKGLGKSGSTNLGYSPFSDSLQYHESFA